jgi:aminoglycoside phosphotransferase (APT) family kinase protein
MNNDDVVALVDKPKLQAWLSDIAVVDGDIEVSVLSGGSSNLTYFVHSGAHQYVLRRRPLGKVAAGAHDMAREHRVQAALQGSAVPLATVYGYTEDESIVGAPCYVMSRVAGSVFENRDDVAALSAKQTDAISAGVIAALDQLHRVDPESVGLATLGKPANFVARRIGRWLDQWDRSEHSDQPMVQELSGALRAQVPSHTDSTIVHGDYRLGNMLIDTERCTVSAVLDWEMSTLGDPLTDLAHLLVYWEPSRGRRTHESQTIADQPGFWNGAQLAARYGELTGRDVKQLDFYLAFEHWRAAIIKDGIATRRRNGAVPGSAEELAVTVPVHLAEAADLLGAAI